MLLASVMATAHAEVPRYVFSANGLDFSLSTYRVLPGGELRHMGHRPIGKASSDLRIHPSGRFVFVVSKTMATIAVYRLERRSGELTPVKGSPFPSAVTSPFALAFHPSGRFVYVAARFTGVGAYAFDEDTGALTPLPGSPYPAQERTRSVAMHPSGRFLYAVNAFDNSVTAYSVDQQTGALQEMPGSPFPVGEVGTIDYQALFMNGVTARAGGVPYNIALDPRGRFAFVTNWAAASVSMFRIDPHSGRLDPVPGSPFFTGYNPYAVATGPDGRFLYVTLYSGEIAVHAIDAERGRLSQISGSPFSSGASGPVALVFNAAGNQLYVPHYESNDIVLLDVDTASGALRLRQALKTRSGPWGLALMEGTIEEAAPAPSSAQTHHPVDGIGVRERIGRLPGFSAQAVALGPHGRFAYALKADEAELVTFAIDAGSGNVSPLAGTEQATGKQPSDIAIDVNGWYLYVTNSGDNNLSVYYLNPQSGLPRAVRGSPIPAGKRPVAITLDPAARYAFVANADADTVSVYRYMNGVTPLIYESRKYGSPFAAGKRPVAVAVEPSGHFAYVANAGSNDIAAYRIHYKIGALSALPGSPFKTGAGPVALLAHPNGKLLFSANAEAREVVVFRIDQHLGAISAVHHLKLAKRPRQLWLNPAGTELTVLGGDGDQRVYLTVDPEQGLLSLRENQAH